jgi:hypothetical protein
MTRAITDLITWFAGSLAIFLLVLNPLVCDLDLCCDGVDSCCDDGSPVCHCPCALLSVPCETPDFGVVTAEIPQYFLVKYEFIPEGILSEIERPPIAA